MEQTIKLEMTKEEASLLSAGIEQCLKTISEAIERIDQAEAETMRLQSETRIMLDQLRTMLNVETNDLQRTQDDSRRKAEYEEYERKLFWLQVENQLLKNHLTATA